MSTIHVIVTDNGLASSGSSSAVGKSGTLVDVLMLHTSDGGEIEYVNGLATMSDGLENAAYLSLFGGNEQDSGLPVDAPNQWWGNLGENDPSRIYRSETQGLLRSLPAIPANLRRLQDAADRDLAWMVDTGLATFVSVLVTMPGLNRVSIEINIEVGDKRYEAVFAARWGAMS